MTSSGGVASDTNISGDLADRVRALVGRLRLRDVRFTKISGELLSAAPESLGEGDVSRGAEYLVQGDKFINRFTFKVEFKDAQGEDVAAIEVVIQFEFELEGDGEPDDEALGVFLEQTTSFMAYPYFREAAQSISARLGLQTVVFGLWRFAAEGPNEVAAALAPDPLGRGG